MVAVKVITKAGAVSFAGRRKAEGTKGIYALIDPTDGTPRYVGSTGHAEHRLYSHLSDKSRCRTPKEKWICGLMARGLYPEMWILEEGDFGKSQSAERMEAEARWIAVCQELFGGADMNTSLTPVGHANSKDSTGKKLHAEIRQLRRRVEDLEHELAVLRGLNAATCNLECKLHRVAECARLSKTATLQLLPLGEVASCIAAGPICCNSANLADSF